MDIERPFSRPNRDSAEPEEVISPLWAGLRARLAELALELTAGKAVLIDLEPLVEEMIHQAEIRIWAGLPVRDALLMAIAEAPDALSDRLAPVVAELRQGTDLLTVIAQARQQVKSLAWRVFLTQLEIYVDDEERYYNIGGAELQREQILCTLRHLEIGDDAVVAQMNDGSIRMLIPGSFRLPPDALEVPAFLQDVWDRQHSQHQ